MGWKAVKDHYQIGHIVQKSTKGICIGSGFIQDIIVIGMDGQLLKRHDGWGVPELDRYQAAMEADPELLKALVNQEDRFEKEIPVFTYDGANIIEKKCETPGWPNVTHDGEIMYENTFSTDKNEVVKWAKERSASAISYIGSSIEEAELRLKEMRERMVEHQGDLDRLNAEYPQEGN